MESKVVIAEEVAAAMLQGWREYFEVELPPETERRLLNAVMRGRLDFDEGSNTFTLKLRSPIELENGKTVAELMIKEPNSQQIRGIMKKSDGDIDMILKMLSVNTGEALGVIERLKMKDLITCGELFNFFG